MLSLNVDALEDSESNNPNLKINDANIDNLHIEKGYQNIECSEETRNQNFTRSIYKNMYILVRELFFLTILVLSYATFQNNTPKVSKSPTAFPFFPTESTVKDWYRGQLSEAINQAIESDLAFVMYYAPWDAESQAVRQEFEIVSQHMHEYIHFAAINCWQPGSLCRQQYNKVYSWPVLMAYPAHGPGIQYRGPRKAEHMLKFLQSISQPFIRITTPLELNTYRATHDAVVVGYVDAKLGSSDFGVLYNTALLFLERDPQQEIQFLIVTGNSPTVFFDFMVNRLPALQLVMWNETLDYPSNKEWKPEKIISWISDSLHQVSVWASLPGGKSQSLSNYLQPGPALILFTPRNPLYELNDYYTILHEVALEYYNCDNNIAVQLQKIILLSQKHKKEDGYHKHTELIKKCSAGQKKNKQQNFPVVTFSSSKTWFNNTCSVSKIDESTCPDMLQLGRSICDRTIRFYPENLKRETHGQDKYENSTHNEHIYSSDFLGSVLRPDTDLRSPANLLRLMEKEKCRFVDIAQRIQPALFSIRTKDGLKKEIYHNVTGMACKTNMSLSIVAIDSLQNHHFAEGLGIDILNKKDKTAVVIINPKYETHHLMNEPYNITNLRNFIHKFASGVLDRILSSTAISRPRTHHYKTPALNNSRYQDTSLEELTTETFLPTVMQPDRAVIVMYHSVKCAFCSGVSHALLSVARLLTPVSTLSFTRIDGDNHALPWEFSMHHYPSILYFPARRKSESRAFPQNVPINISNIISFILANVEPEMRLHIIWTICSHTKYEPDLESCVRTMRIESLSIIGRALREYRISVDVRRRAMVFRRLQLLRSLQFLFTSPLNANTIQQHMAMLISNKYINSNKRMLNDLL